MTVVRIALKKVLRAKRYSYGDPSVASFSSEYLVQTNAPFPSPQLGAYAINLAQAESRLYSTWVDFELATVKLATPGAKPEALHGQYSRIDLSKIHGQLEINEEDPLAYPPVTAVFVRVAQWGRNGRLLIPYALTVSEWNLYTQKRVLPLRFQRQNPLHQATHSYQASHAYQAPHPSFSQELINAVHAAQGSHVMPSVVGESEQELRKVTDFAFDCFQVGSTTRKRRKASQAVSDVSSSKKRANSKSPTEGVVYLLKSGGHFKIGKSFNVKKRVGQLKIQLPEPVEVVHVIHAAHALEAEAQWHRRFASRRRNGEWFVLTEEEVVEFKSVSQM